MAETTSTPPTPPKPQALSPTAMPARPHPPSSMPPARQDTPAQPARALAPAPAAPAASGPRALSPASAKPSTKKASRKERVKKATTAKRVRKAAAKSTASPVRKAAKAAAGKLKGTVSATTSTTVKPKEIDPTKLDQGKATKRLSAIYALERVVERKMAIFESASKARRAARAELEEAQEALKLEIQEQRFGPGPLWNADGSGPAGTPQADERKTTDKVDDDDGDND